MKAEPDPVIVITRDGGYWCFHVGSHVLPISVNGRPCWRDTASAVNVVAYIRDTANGPVKVKVE